MIAVVTALTAGCDSSDKQAARAPEPAADTAAPEINEAVPAQGSGPASRRALFGDLHLHTSMSFDAAASETNTLPEDSYRFARGEIVDYLGQRVKRKAPLDFLAVTDHAEYLGVARVITDVDGPFAGTKSAAMAAEKKKVPMGLMSLFSPSGFRMAEPPIGELMGDETVLSNWQRQIQAAEAFNDPGRFTTFVAFEWSPMPGGAHMHRNVIFKGPDFPMRPFSSLQSPRPEDLWTYAENLQAQGIEALLIPHNSNLSEGLMFAYKDSDGNPISRAYAERRARNELLVEISQNKGTSETLPIFSPDDEFANFELMPQPTDMDAATLAGGFIRQAYARGLELLHSTGANPFRFGLVGASDFHSGVSASEEDNFPGGLGIGDDQSDPAKLLTSLNPVMRMPTTVLSAGGITGVWAEQNTRESIFNALRRREVFATSGPRMQVRMFAGWRFDQATVQQQDWIATAYQQGVAMGADLTAQPDGASAPVFLLQAIKDPDGANIDRIQIVKIWYADGAAHEKVFDALWGDAREIDPTTGKLPAVGNTVDLGTAEYENSIGAATLLGAWQDPEFDAQAPAIYYARVMEIPTPRWPTYLAARNGLPLSTDVPPTLQERAWTSPVFYNP